MLGDLLLLTSESESFKLHLPKGESKDLVLAPTPAPGAEPVPSKAHLTQDDFKASLVEILTACLEGMHTSYGEMLVRLSRLQYTCGL